MHALWNGTLSFGLVNIPVQMYTASREKELSFVLLHKKDLSQVRYARICRQEEKEIPWEEIVKGYEYGDGKYVILQDTDFQKANLKKTKTIEILQFVEEGEIDSVYYVKPYFLEPQSSGTKAYSLLREALKKSKKVGLARYVVRNREHLAVVKVHDEMLILNELRYQNELLRPPHLNIPSKIKANPKELEIAIKLIEQLVAPFKPQVYKDTYSEELKQIIKKKSKGKAIRPTSREPKPTKIHDIMSLLQASLAEESKPKRKTRKTG